jgi:hypothetical protein
MHLTRIEKTRPTVHVLKSVEHVLVSHDKLNIVAESNLPLGCAHIGGKSTYAISRVSPRAACPTSPPSAAYALYLRDRRISIHISALRARYYFRLIKHGDCLKERAARVRTRQPENTSPAVHGVLKYRKSVRANFVRNTATSDVLDAAPNRRRNPLTIQGCNHSSLIV